MTLTNALQQVALWVRMRTERGSALVEYALLITLIAVVCLLAINQLGQNANEQYSQLAESLVAIG